MIRQSVESIKTSFVATAICFVAMVSQSFAETIQGDYTINEDRELTEDLTVSGTLILENGATIDLQGHKLTVGGFANNSPNLVANGSFEEFTDNTQINHPDRFYGYKPTVYYAFFDSYDSICNAGPLALHDWDYTKASGDAGAGLAQNNIINTTVPDGKNVLFYLGKRTISQTVNIPANGLYSLSYYYGARGNTTSGGRVQIDIGAKTGLAPVHCTSKDASKTECFVELPEGEQAFKIRGTGGGSGNTSHHWMDGVVLKQTAIITDTSTDGGGELHFTGGAATLNNEISVNGNLKVILHGQTVSGDLTVNVDMTLAGDVAVNGTITMDQSATLDLNGNELTAQGIETGYDGDLTMPSGTIISDCKLYDSSYKVAVAFNDNFTVKGDATHRILYDLTKNGPFWVTYDFGEDNLRTVSKYKVWFGQNAGSAYAGRAPKTWVFEGSNDNVNWDPVDSRSNETSWTCPSSGTAVAREYTCSNPGAYRYYRWKCTAHNGKDNYLEFVQLEYFGSKPVVTDTSTGTPGKLRFDVPEGTTLTHDSVIISGNLDFVKDGAGTFTCATEGLMTYLGDTYIKGGTYLCGLNGPQHPFGRGENLVVNGDFETDPSTGAITGYKYYNAGSGPAFEWSGWGESSVGSGLALKGKTFISGDLNVGKYAAFVHGPGGQGRCIAQKLSAIPAGAYNLSFKYAASRKTCVFDCLLENEGASLTLFTGKTADRTTVWTTWGDTVTIGESGTYTLKFRISAGSSSSYDPGIVIDNVVLRRISDVHVADGATLDLNGKVNFGNYKFILDGGTLRNFGADIGAGTAQIANIVLTEDSTLDVHRTIGMIGTAYNATKIDLGGKTLSVNVASGKTFYLFNTDVTAGTLDISGEGTVRVDKTGLRAQDATLKIASALNGAVPMTVGGYTAAYTGTANSGTGAMRVTGVFRPEASGYYANCVLQNGATFDFGGFGGEFPLTGVAFADGAEIAFGFAGRTDLLELADNKTYVFEWTERPNAAFTLDGETASRQRVQIKVCANGIQLIRKGGLTVIIR